MKLGIGATAVLVCLGVLAGSVVGQAANPPDQVINAYSELPNRAGPPPVRIEVVPARGFGLVKAGAAVDAGEFYRASGRKIRLFRSLDKVAVRAQDPAAALGQMNAAADAEFAAEATVPSAGLHVLKAGERLTEVSLNAALGVADTDPVYINEETGNEMLVTDRFVVRLAPGVARAALDALNRAQGVAVVSQLHGTDREYVCQKVGATAPETLALCEVYHQDASTAWASPDFIIRLKLRYTPTDPLYSSQWHLHNTAQAGGTADADVDAPEAWDDPDTPQGGHSDVVIAIIDSGVDLDHEDLQSNIYQNPLEAGGTPGVDDDLNGYIDDVNGWDFYDNDNTPDPTAAGDPSPEPHGTACSGVAAAVEGNALGGVGVAFNCKILPVKLSSDSGTFASSASIGSAIRYAADIANVLSNSWGGGGDDATIHSAIQYAVNSKGKVVLFASGNDADGTNSSPCWIRYVVNTSGGTRYFEFGYVKNGSISSGEDAMWIDDIVFPDGSTEGFEGSFPPSGWTTGGSAPWTQYGESKHVLGSGCYSAKSGSISHSQTTWLRSPQKTFTTNDVSFYAWTDCEYYNDYGYLYVEGLGYVWIDDAGYAIYDVEYPARYSECIAVGASTTFDRRSAYSQYDETLVNVLDIVAPSSGRSYLTAGITTTDIEGSYGYDPGNYTSTFGGTSSATPLAAGVVALMLSKTCLSPADVRTILHDSADEIGCQSYSGGYNKYYGHGRVNADAALAATPAPDFEKLKLTILNPGWGTVTVYPNCVDPFDPNLRRYCLGTVVRLEARPNDGKSFGVWKIFGPNYPGDPNDVVVDSNNPLFLTMDSDKNVQGNFKCGSGLAPFLPVVLLALGGLTVVRRCRSR